MLIDLIKFCDQKKNSKSNALDDCIHSETFNSSFTHYYCWLNLKPCFHGITISKMNTYVLIITNKIGSIVTLLFLIRRNHSNSTLS